MRRSSRPSSRSSDSSSPTGSRSSSPDSGKSGTGRPSAARQHSSFDRSLLAQDSLVAARALLGARLVRQQGDDRRVGRIVEVEAYIGTDDQASHARFGRTARNRVMFGRPGVAYVYLVYGMYDCLNVVTEPEPRPAAVLVRAVEPLEGIDAMRTARMARLSRRRGLTTDEIERERARLESIASDRLASGPGLVTAAFSIDRSDTGTDLCEPSSPLRLEASQANEPPLEILSGPRVGIAYAGQPWTEHRWRFAIAGNHAVSGPPIQV